jgi:hypothetical protein
MFLVQTNELVDLLNAQTMVNMMKNISNPNPNMQLSFKKTENNRCKESIKKDNDKKSELFSNGKPT